MPALIQLVGINNIGDVTLQESLRTNLINFLDYGLINVGGFFNVVRPTSGVFGGNEARLRPVNDGRGFSNGQVWESFRNNWVWESGLSYSTQPISISGVWVNNVFQPSSGVGTYAHSINYIDGRVIFDTAISTNSTVEVEYSYKWVSVSDARDVPYAREIQPRSLRINEDDFLTSASGELSQYGLSKAQLPIIGINVSNNTTFKPYALGGGQKVYRKLIFHILAEDEYTAGKLADIVSYVNDKTMMLYDVQRVVDEGRFPLNIDGTIASGALTFPDMVRPSGNGGFFWRKLFLQNTNIQTGQWLGNNLYKQTVSMVGEIVMGEI